MAPHRVAPLTERLNVPELTMLVRLFHAEFESDGTASDLVWFPAWVLIVLHGWPTVSVKRKRVLPRRRDIARGCGAHTGTPGTPRYAN